MTVKERIKNVDIGTKIVIRGGWFQLEFNQGEDPRLMKSAIYQEIKNQEVITAEEKKNEVVIYVR